MLADVTVDDLDAACQAGATLVDVREDDGCAAAPVPGAQRRDQAGPPPERTSS